MRGKNTIRFRMLKDGRRIQLDLHPALHVDKIVLGSVRLKYTRGRSRLRRLSQTLQAGHVYSIDFFYSGHPVETGRFGGITFAKIRRPSLDQHRLRRDRRQRVVAEQGPVARRGGEHGDQRVYS